MNAILAGLLNGIVVSAALAFVVVIALSLLPARLLNSATRYAIWWIVLAVTVALPLSYFRPPASGGSTRPYVSRTVATQTTGYHPAAPALKYAVSSPPMSKPVPRLPTVTFPLTLPAGPWPGRIMTIWLIASSLALIRLGWSAVLLERRKARAVDAPAIHNVRVVVSSEISIPLVAGPWKRRIMLPARLLDELDEHELEQIGIHEAAHLLRGDDYALLIQRILEAFFALHPVVCWISRRIDLEREIACDDRVIAATGDAQPYAACLARVVQLTGGILATPTATSATDRSHLARRVDMLLDKTRHPGTRLLALRLSLATTCLAAMSWGAVQLPGLIAFATAPARAKQPAPISIPAPTPLIAQVERPPIPATKRAVTQQPAAPVLVSIVVQDPLGRFVTGLDQSTFKVREDGIEQVTTELSQLADSDDRADLFVLVGAEVNPDPTLEPLLGERAGLTRYVDIVHVHGWGQLQPDLRHLSKHQGVLLVTNSAASTEHYTDTDLQNIAGIDMPVYVLDLSATADTPVQAFLKELASRTGGDYIPVKQQQELPDLLAKAVIAVLNEYVLTYTPTNTARDGAYRNVEVSISQPRGLPPLTVHFRPGYNAPAQ
jgi:beta-lactamase regulating signal transducer with metallopeptidase domain